MADANVENGASIIQGAGIGHPEDARAAAPRLRRDAGGRLGLGEARRRVGCAFKYRPVTKTGEGDWSQRCRSP
jgi:hypothetical protein